MAIITIEVHTQQTMSLIKELEKSNALRIVPAAEAIQAIPEWQQVLILERKKQLAQEAEGLVNWEDVKDTL